MRRVFRNKFIQFFLLFVRLPRVKDDRRHRVQSIFTAVRRLRLAAVLLVGGISMGTLGYVLIENYPWFDAFYMTVITLATVGFGEVYPLSFWGKLFTAILILFNLGLFTYSISSISSLFAEGGFSKLLRDFLMQKTIQDLRGHVIVCGFGRHSAEVVNELTKQGASFVIIENNRDKIELLQEEGEYLYVEGDATDDEVLEEAGIHRALAIVITLPSDADNLYITLSARQANPHVRIICRAHSAADEIKLRRAGANHTVLPERIGGFYMATLIEKPDLVEFFTLLSNMGPGNVVFEEIPLNQLNAKFSGKTIESCGLFRNSRISLIAIRNPYGQYELNPPRNTVLQPGHHIVVLGNADQVAEFMESAK